MRPVIKNDGGQRDLFRSHLEQIIAMDHPLVRLRQLLDWEAIAKVIQPYYAFWGRPGVPVQLILGLHFLKYIYGLSDEEICWRWEENPYFQYFCGEAFFQHKLPMNRSSMSYFRERVEVEALEKLLQESLAAAREAGALHLKDLRKVALDTTVQEKAIAHPTEHGLLLRAVQRLSQIATRSGLKLRQSYRRIVKSASVMAGRYVHAHQLGRFKRKVKFMRIRLGRLIRDVHRKARVQCEVIPRRLEEALDRARHIMKQKRGDPDYRYSWHEPEVECIGKGKARKPYEFGCKVSLATQLRVRKGCRHFILGAQALHGRPYDGHTLDGALAQLEAIIGKPPEEGYVDKGYRGHKTERSTRIFISGQRRGITARIKQDLRRRSVIEPIIGHAKNDGHLGRHWLKGRKGDKMNALFSATGFNLRQLLGYLQVQSLPVTV